MALTALVWVLIFSGGNYRPAVQLGPYADQESCEAVRKALYVQYVTEGKCVQVRIPSSN